jgi:hypothetical protein
LWEGGKLGDCGRTEVVVVGWQPGGEDKQVAQAAWPLGCCWLRSFLHDPDRWHGAGWRGRRHLEIRSKAAESTPATAPLHPRQPRRKRYKLPTPSFPPTIWEVGSAVNQHTLSLLFPTAARGSIPTTQVPVIPGPILGVSMVSELSASFCEFLASPKFLISL